MAAEVPYMTGRILRVLLMPDVKGITELVLNRFVAWLGIGSPRSDRMGSG